MLYKIRVSVHDRVRKRESVRETQRMIEDERVREMIIGVASIRAEVRD